MPKRKRTWSSLNNNQKRNAIQKVIEKAYWDSKFHARCLDPQKMRGTIEKEAGVRFGDDIEVRCFEDRAAAEKQVLIQLAPLIPIKVVEGEAPQPPPEDQAFWMCTYSTYSPNQ